MKTFILALLLFVTPAHAFDVETCSVLGNLAENVMEKRQLGASMSDMIKVVPSNHILQAIIVEAYEKPRYNTEDIRQRTIEDFRDQIFLMCIKE